MISIPVGPSTGTVGLSSKPNRARAIRPGRISARRMFETARVSATLWMAWAPNAEAQYTAQGPKLTALDSQGYAHFCKAIAISGDGNTALIGGFDDQNG